MADQTLDISWQTIGRVILACFLVYVTFLAKDVVIWFFFALIISLLMDPLISFLRNLRMPKILAVALVYLFVLGVLGLVIFLTAPIFTYELNQLTINIPVYFEKINPILKDMGILAAQNFQEFTAMLVASLKQSSDSVLRAVTTFFGGVYSALLIFSLAFFISLEEKGVERVLTLLTPRKYETNVVALFERAQYKVSRWFGARIVSCLFVGVTSFITFFLLDVKYAFILALISAILNFVPYIGPTITLILSVLFIGVSNSWIVAIYAFVIILIIQEIENKALTPLLMKKFIDLPPVLVLISLLVGGVVFGFLGTLFAVPVFGIIYEFTKEFLQRKKEEAI